MYQEDIAVYTSPQRIVVKNNNYLFPVLWVSGLGWARQDGLPLPHVVWLKIKVKVLIKLSLVQLFVTRGPNLAGLSGVYLEASGTAGLSPGGPCSVSSSRRLVQMPPLAAKRDRSEQPQSFNE